MHSALYESNIDPNICEMFAETKATTGETILDILSITCLLSLMNDYWVVPVKAVENGGRT